MAVAARLVPDAGAAAASEEFFRCPEFLEAEGVTHTLRVEGERGTVALPVIVRSIAGMAQVDASSPYGYPGGGLKGEPPDPLAADWGEAGLVSLFVRDRVGELRSLAGGVERSSLQVADPELPRKSRMSDRRQVRKNEARGYVVRRVEGPSAPEPDRHAFHRVYEQTMRRTKAAERYFFERRYFDTILRSERASLFLCDTPGAEGVAAAAIVVSSDGFLHYHLSGSADEHLANAPSKNLIFAVIEHAAERGAPLNLGGGVRPGDGLEEFKRGFANRQVPFVTHEVVCDTAAYERLSAGLADSGFFPLYRAGD